MCICFESLIIIILCSVFHCRHGQRKCIRLLLDRGARVVTDNDGVSVLELCAQGDYHECVELILDKYPEQVDKVRGNRYYDHGNCYCTCIVPLITIDGMSL